MLVAAIESEVDVLLWIISHANGLTFCEFDQVVADLNDYVLHLGVEGLVELTLSRCDAQRVDQLDDELGVVFVVEVALKLGIGGEGPR